MDEHRFDEWLSLWTDPARYWIPCNEDDIDPRTMSRSFTMIGGGWSSGSIV